METVRYHAASVLVFPSDCNKTLLAVYDDTYPVKAFQGHFVFIGGNARKDYSPRATLQRELFEEFGIAASGETVGHIIGSADADVRNDGYLLGRRYAPESFRMELKEDILNGLEGCGDYRVRIGKEPLKMSDDLDFITSIYVSSIDRALFDEAEGYLASGSEMRNEGFTRVLSRDAIMKGLVRGAWGCSAIAGEIMGIKVPEYPFVNTVSLGQKPLQAYSEYKKQFHYVRDPQS